ncbi:translocation/assembly module TamB domain-containing protein [Polymorphum gilvum]|uniref:Translocation and assembly module TamB C-terminal domain-containing protein n=1 Tax=Polymorphum gilvum (strain LMG 25793 / CGMCC 1.9160 / SL003B-26A1) TaxID=991905 RepID=F2J5W5_POLGS|nr:translocation/assembly module TamB domain-containing protein [Polymorphum gilvum]ADZ71219.1 hypothetical protein SL003B_2796 [Polymorphum gilvum SL003B-26A1]
MHPLRRVLKGLAYTALALGASVVALGALLPTPLGGIVIERIVNAALEGDGGRTTVSGVGIGWTGDLRVDAVTVADAAGPWLTLADLRLDWRPSRLLAGEAFVDTLTAGAVHVARRPVAAADGNDGADRSEGSLSLPVPRLRLERLAVAEIRLAAPVAGTPLTLTASGSARIDDDPQIVRATLDIRRADGTAGTIGARIDFAPGDGRLGFDLDVSEPRGGLVARLMEIPDLPALDIRLAGDGPLDDWGADLTVALDGRQTVTGTARLGTDGAGRMLSVDLDGDLAPLAPPVAAAFLLGSTELKGEARLNASFEFLSGRLSLTTQTVRLDADGGLDPLSQQLSGKGTLSVGAGGGALIALDIDGRRVAFGAVSAELTLSGALSKANWTLAATATQLSGPEGAVERLTLDASGSGADLRAEHLTSPLRARLALAGVAAADGRLAALAGDTLLTLAGRIDGAQAAATIEAAELSAPAGRLVLTEAHYAGDAASARGRIDLADLGALSALAGRPLGGTLTGAFAATGRPATASGTLAVSLEGRDLKTGSAEADRLLAGTVTAEATADRAEDGTLRVTGLSLTGPGLALAGDAALAAGSLEAEVQGRLSGLHRLDPRLEGEIALNASARGPFAAAEVALEARSDRLVLTGTPVEAVTLTISGTASPEAPAGTLALAGTMNGAPLTASADLVSENGGARIDRLEARAGGNRIAGSAEIGDLDRALETLTGRVSVDAPQLADLSPLVLTPITGRLNAEVSLAAEAGLPRLRVTANGADLSVPGADVAGLTAEASVLDPFGVPRANGTLGASGVRAGGTALDTVALEASSDGMRTDFTLDARLPSAGGRDGLAGAGTLTAADGGFDLAVTRLDGAYAGLTTALAQPARFTYRGEVLHVDALALALGSGTLTVTGTAGERLDLTARVADVPLALANAVAPGLGLGGSASGTVTASGAAGAPVATWNLSVTGLSASATAGLGLPALGLASSGRLSGNRIDQTTTASGPDGTTLTAKGTVGLEGARALDLALDGTVPLALARRTLTEAGFRGEGAMRVTGRVGGTVAAPRPALTAVPSGVRVTELSSGLTLQDVTGSIDIDGERIVLNGLKAAVAGGGTLSVSGSVGLGGDMAADIRALVDKGRYSDGRVVTAVADADIRISGPLAGSRTGALMSGTVSVERADIAIPETLPGGVSPVAVQHVNAPAAVRAQMAELRADGGGGSGGTGEAPMRLDVTVNAPGRIFVRGRGVDAELSGSLRVVGTTAEPQAIGAFTLRRGQLDVLTRRLAFSRGSATFSGSLTPELDFLATTSAGTTTVNVTVTGSAADPVVALTSVPSLPQDEILAQLLFDRSMSTLSPTQLAQLAAAVATLTGGSDRGPLAQLRRSLGLDAIDVNAAVEGGPSVAVGKYINDNIYLGVEQGTGRDSSRVTVDIDITKGLKMRGEVGADGSSKAGIFYEREY